MKLNRIIIAVAATLAVCLAITACNSTTTTIEPAVGADGKPLVDAKGQIIMKKTVTEKESPARHKSFGIAGGGTVIRLKTSASAESDSSTTPEFDIGTHSTAIASAPEEDNKPVVAMNSEAGVLTSLTSSSAKSFTLTYVGVKNESAAETKARLTALLAYQAGTLTESANPDSASTN